MSAEGLLHLVPLRLSSDAICSNIFIRMCQSQIFFTHNTCRFTSGVSGLTCTQQQIYITDVAQIQTALEVVRIDIQLCSGDPTLKDIV